MRWPSFIGERKIILWLIITVTLAYFFVAFAPKTVSPDSSIIISTLDETPSFSDYMTKLFTLKTVDFQPIRDLTFVLDQKIYDLAHVNTFVLQNLLYWVIACGFVFRLLTIEFSEVSQEMATLLTLAFAVYPLFVATLPWGMARKHILAFMFIIAATLEFRLHLRDRKVNRSWKIGAYYFLSVFSQPISILWGPVTGVFLLFSNRDRKMDWGLLGLLGFIFLCGFVSNYLYYQESMVFKTAFNSKTSLAFELGDQVLAFGVYLYGLIFPYRQVFMYDHAHWSAWVGMVILAVLLLAAFRYKSLFYKNLYWLAIGFSPLALILLTPLLITDTYLLMPAFAGLMVTASVLKPSKSLRAILAGLIVFWATFDCTESRKWTDTISFWRSSFERRPQCKTALDLFREVAREQGKADESAQNFLMKERCLVPSPQHTHIQTMNVLETHSQVLYFSALPDDVIETNLKSLSRVYYYSEFVYVSWLLKRGREAEAHEELTRFLKNFGDRNFLYNYDSIITHDLYPYCVKKDLKDCLRIAEKFSRHQDKPFY